MTKRRDFTALTHAHVSAIQKEIEPGDVVIVMVHHAGETSTSDNLVNPAEFPIVLRQIADHWEEQMHREKASAGRSKRRSKKSGRH